MTLFFNFIAIQKRVSLIFKQVIGVWYQHYANYLVKWGLFWGNVTPASFEIHKLALELSEFRGLLARVRTEERKHATRAADADYESSPPPYFTCNYLDACAAFADRCTCTLSKVAPARFYEARKRPYIYIGIVE